MVETAEMAAMTAVSAMGALTTIDQHCQTKVLCKFEGNRRKFFGGDPGVVRTLNLIILIPVGVKSCESK